MNDEFRQLGKAHFTISEGDEAYSVKSSGSTENSVSKALNECTCLCFANFGLPCRRIFACRREKNVAIYDEALIPKRWVKEFEVSGSNKAPLLTPKASTNISKCKTSQPNSVIEKFNKANEVCRDIATFFYRLVARLNFKKN